MFASDKGLSIQLLPLSDSEATILGDTPRLALAAETPGVIRQIMFSSSSIHLPMTGWIPVDGDLGTWRNEAGDVLSTHYFPQPPDLPAPLGDMDSIRSAYRRLLRERGAIIELEPEQIMDCHALRAIFKIAQEANRVMYMATLMIPFRDHNFMVKVTCPEVGASNLRDAAVAMRLGASGSTAWYADPYDASYSNPILRNRSEDAEWDSIFPDHPLSRARSHTQRTLLQAELPPSLPPFDGPPSLPRTPDE